jgi:hypothetical protein
MEGFRLNNIISVLQEYDQKFLNDVPDEFPIVEFYAWDSHYFCSFSNNEKLEILSLFFPQSVALKIWQQLQWCLLGDEHVDKELMWSCYRELDFIQQNMWYSQLNRAVFIGKSISIDMRSYYDLLIDSFCRSVEYNIEVQPLKGQGDTNLAVVITNQFLTSLHGPTLTTLNYASCLQKMGMQVVIVCTTSVARPHQMLYPMPAPAFFGNVIDDYYQDDIQINLDLRDTYVAAGKGAKLQCWGEQFNFLQLDTNEHLTHLKELVDFINQADPRYIFCIGGLNPAAEFIARSRPVLAIPCVTSLQLPKYMVPTLLRELTETDEQVIVKHQLPHPVFESRLPFRLRPHQARKESNPAHPMTMFAICGYRLEHEMTAPFFQTLRRIRLMLPKAVFVLIGAERYQGYPDDLLSCSEFTGNVTNSIEIIGQCHFLLNPKRQGGGTAAIEALSLGVPVLTGPYGDTYQYVGEDFTFNSDEELLSFVKSYLASSEFQADYTERCLERAALMTDTRRIFQPLFLEYDCYLHELND